jgi:YD repeat-containing protein
MASPPAQSVWQHAELKVVKSCHHQSCEQDSSQLFFYFIFNWEYDMKSLYLFLLGCCLSFSAFAADNGMVMKASKFSVAETMDRFENEAKVKGFTIVARVDHAAAAEKAGMKMPASQLLIFGNPKGGTPLMLASPTTGIDLPLKALAYEDAEGKIWLAYNAADYLKSRHAISGKDDAIGNVSKALDAMAMKAVE